MESVFLLLIFAFAFVMLIVLPARARARIQQRTREMQDSLTVGTEVMMTCGLYGTIAELHDTTVGLEVAPGVVVLFARAAVAEVTTSSEALDETSDTTAGEAPDEVASDQRAAGSD